MASTTNFEEDCIEQIIDVLELEGSTEAKIIAKNLILGGRQKLSSYERKIAPNIFREQMKVNGSEILQILKQYNEKKWKETITDQWLHDFLNESKDVYDQILRRSAEFGSKFLKDSPTLSLTLQCLFEFDDETIGNDDLFDKIWVTILEKGCQGIEQYKRFISPDVLRTQLDSDQSPLCLAVKDYFRETLEKLFDSKEINITRKEAKLKVAVDCVARFGCLEGLDHERVRDCIAEEKLDKLKAKFKELLIEMGIGTVVEAGKNTVATESTTLVNTSVSDTNAHSQFPGTPQSVKSSSSSASISPTATVNQSIDSQHNTSDIDLREKNRERIDQIKMVTSCVNLLKKLSLSDLVQAGELVYMDQRLDYVLKNIIDDYRAKPGEFSSFIHDCFTPIMYLLKRHQNLDDFMVSLLFRYDEIQSDLNLPRPSLRMIIHILLLNSDMPLCRKILNLLSKRNPVPLFEPALEMNDELSRFVPDIFYVWDYSMPTILSFGIGSCEGKSTIINSIFLTSFEQSNSSIYFANTIDIDFGFSFLPRRSTNIADAHGSMKKDLLEKIHNLFDGFLVHVQYDYLQKQIEEVAEFLRMINHERKYRLMIVRDVPISKHTECNQLLAKYFTGINTFIVPNIADQNNTQNKNFILRLKDRIWENMPKNCLRDESFLKNELMHLMSKSYRENLDRVNQMVMPLEKILTTVALNESVVERYFPEYLKFVEICDLRLKLARFNFYANENDGEVYAVRTRLFALQSDEDSRPANPSQVYGLFRKLMEADNMLTCFELLLEDLKRQRIKLVDVGDMAKQLPIQKSLSLEVLWRNCIICSQYESIHVQKQLQAKYYEYIEAGFPFEIVDGDNFYFQYSFLLEALKSFRGHKTLVISVIGPQNSGKSTLLNYMFGTLFDVRDGRCTRGIYGSFVKTNRTDFEYILLIDTEGLLSIERKDEEYDRRIVLFCLAVSHLVLVNMIGELNTTLRSMLTLCTDSLSKMGVTHIPRPVVHFILNQKADLNIENNQAAIDRVIADYKEHGLGESIDIKKEAFHTLPSAFKREGQTVTSNAKLPNVVKTAPEFIECVQLLCGEIIRSAALCLDRAKEFLDPVHWLTSSNTIFETLQKFSDLTYYRDIHERRLDNQIREHIRDELTKTFSPDYRDQLSAECLNKSGEEIDDLFLIRKSKIQQDAQKNVESLFKFLKVPDTLRRRSEQFLSVQIAEMFNALRTSSIAVNEREKVRLIVRTGKGDLEKLINDIIHSGEVMSPEQATQRFETLFNRTINRIQQGFVPEERLKQAIKHIYSNYNIYEKDYLLDFATICSNLAFLSDLNDSNKSLVQSEHQLTIYFTVLGYQNDSVSANHFNPTCSISLEMIRKMAYLNKENIENVFYHCFQQDSSPSVQGSHRRDGHRNSNKNPIRAAWNFVSSPFRGGSGGDNVLQIPNPVNTEKFQLDIRDAIRKQKPKQTRGHMLDEQELFFAISKVVKEVIARIFKAMEGSDKVQVRQIRTELIQKIVGLINSLSIDVDNELAPFCLSLSRPLKATFHTCAVVLMSKYYYDEQRNHFIQTLSELQTKKPELENYFKSMVVPNAAVDETYAKNLGTELRDYVLRQIEDDGQAIINSELNRYDNLNRKWIQDRCDGQLLTNTNELWHLDYIENPTKIIEEFFKNLWTNIEREIDQKLADRKSFYLQLLNEFFYNIQAMASTVSSMGAAVQFVDSAFALEESNSCGANENLINKNRCMAILLNKYFSTRSVPSSFMHNHKIYHLRADILNAFCLLLEQRKPSDDLAKIISQLSNVFDSISIINLSVFLQTLIHDKNQLITDVQTFKCDFKNIDSQDTFVRLLDKVRGCPDLCPCCRRPCDVDHTEFKSKPGSQYNEHRCRSGHTLRAMNGYKFEVNNEASLLMCEQIADENFLTIGTKRCQWIQFKKDHPDWIFDSSLDETEINRLHGKFLTVWEKIGPTLCARYGMTFVTHNTPQVVHTDSYHFVLLLDASGSMGGERWDHLKEAVEEFIKRRLANKTEDRITIIVFSSKARVVCEDIQIGQIDMGKVVFLDGGTSFENAFECLDGCLTRFKPKISTHPVYENYAIIFMSDGEANFPERQLDQILKAHDTVIKRFWTIALGLSEGKPLDTLKRINDKMNGSFYDVANSADLIQTYAEVACSMMLTID